MTKSWKCLSWRGCDNGRRGSLETDDEELEEDGLETDDEELEEDEPLETDDEELEEDEPLETDDEELEEDDGKPNLHGHCNYLFRRCLY